MHRRALLSGLAGGAALLAGCSTDASPPKVYNPTGTAKTRPLDEPFARNGITSETEQYVYARLFRPGDEIAVVDDPDAQWLAEGVDALSEGQFALLTMLRTAGAAPAYLWPRPSGTVREDDRVRIELERKTITTDGEADEVVGVALTTFEHDGDPPAEIDVVLPGGAVLSVDG